MLARAIEPINCTYVSLCMNRCLVCPWLFPPPLSHPRSSRPKLAAMSSLTRLPARRAISAALQKDRITPAIRYVPGPSRSSLNRTYATHASGSTLSSPSINPEVAYRNGEAVSSGKLDVGIPEIGMQDTYDIVIIGAGNAGLALVASLRMYTAPHTICTNWN